MVLLTLLLSSCVMGNEEYLAHTQQAVEHAQNGRIDDAISSCELSLKIKSDDAAPYHLMSQLYLAKAQHEEALKHIVKAQSLDPNKQSLKASVKFHEGVVAQDRNSFPKALDLFKEASSLNVGQEMDLHLMEKIIIAVASLGDVPTTVKLLKEIWQIAPQYQFHNSLPFVRVADRLDDLLSTGGAAQQSATLAQLSNVTQITDRVWFDVASGTTSGRVVIGLYRYAAPRAVENFVALAECSKGPKFCYKGSKFHRIIADFIVQGGDILPGDGTGTTNIYERPYGDEPFGLALMNNAEGVVQLANAGQDTNGGQFVILMGPAPHLNGNHVVLGKVLEGLEFAKTLNKAPVDAAHRPVTDVIIQACGKL